MNRDRMHEMLDACRPDSEDVHGPDMQELADAIARDDQLGRAYQAAQRADASIGKAYRTVSTPEGLLDRLLEDLGAPSSPELADKPEPVARKPRQGRGLRVWGPVALVAAASVLAMVIYYPFASELDVSSDRARNAIVAEWLSEASTPDDWHDSTRMPAEFPGPQQVSASLARWKVIDGGQTVCYHLVTRENQLAVLFVSKHSATPVPAAPMLPDAAAYQGTYLTTAWEAKGHVFVLAVGVRQGSPQDLLRQIIRVQAA